MPRNSKPGNSKPGDSGPQRRCVLITRFSALGDVALCIPPLYDSCRRHPEVSFVVLTRRHPATLFINPPANLHVEGVDTDRYQGLAGLRRLWREMNARWRFTDFVDLHDVLRTKVLRIMARLDGVKVTVFRKGRRAKKALTRPNGKVLVPLRPTAARYADALKAAGMGAGPDFTSVFPALPAPDRFAAATAPKEEGEYWLAVAPFARHQGKIYPLPLMRKVVEHFAARPRCKVFLFGFGDEESAVIESWAQGKGNVVNMASRRIGLEAELALLAYCDTMLSMDSANMHLASLVGLRTVSVWGATHPYTGFMGFGQKERDAVQLNMTCRPCSVFGNKPCRRGDYHCLAGISPKLIIDRISEPFYETSSHE